MARHVTVEKRYRQSVVNNKRNRASRSEIKTATMAVLAAAGTDEAATRFSHLAKLLDKAVKSNLLKKNTVARKKSRLAKTLNQAR